MSLGYSLKNIPLPSVKEYKKALLEKVESVIRRMRWKAFFFLGGQSETHDYEDTHFGFKSRMCPPQVQELKQFEDDMFTLVDSVTFRPTTNSLLRKMQGDLKSVRETNDVIVPADKTRNLYRVPKDHYQKLLHDNITRTYKLAPDDMFNEINTEAQEIAGGLGLAERMDVLAKADAFVTLKDHKPNFNDTLPCRLLNPAKPELGVVSKTILERMTGQLRKHVKLWKNTASVIEWFEGLENKDQCSFVVFDIVEFYPSITQDLLRKALEFAQQYCSVDPSDIEIIMHARKSLLFEGGRAWQKKDKDTTFDVTMGSYDGAEACELVGAYILSKLAPFFAPGDVGLYRDDGLAVLRNASGHSADKTRKDVTKVFDSLGLKITIVTNRTVVDFLDTTLNIRTAMYRPYRKPNDTPLYVSTESNHPPVILRNIPEGISKRLSGVSCSEAVFKESTPVYADALAASGHPKTMTYHERTTTTSNKKRRKRKVIWFNPPFSKNVKTNIGARFLQLIKRHFPAGSKLNKIFNKNTVKMSYSCMPNMAARIKAHNKGLLAPPTTIKPCNCRVKEKCPLPGMCQSEEVIYQAKASVDDTTKTYTGMSAPPVKTRISSHVTTFQYPKYEKSTELAKHVWSAKKAGKSFEIEWSIIDRAKAYSNISKKCNLCTTEKFHILKSSGPSSLNKRSELVSKCRHQNNYLLAKFKGVT